MAETPAACLATNTIADAGWHAAVACLMDLLDGLA
jgi:hypothetical protein